MAEINAEQVYGEYLVAYVKGLGGGDASRTDHGDMTESMRAAVALAAYDATERKPPRTKADLVAEVKRLLEAPASPHEPDDLTFGRVPRRE